jgi:VanZ family protein
MNWNRWRRLAGWLAGVALIYWAFIFFLTHVPGSGGRGIPGADKVVHFLAYFGLAVLIGAAAVLWRGSSRSLLIGVWLLVAGYGIVDELSQTLVPGRTCSAADWLADALGGLAGILLVFACSRRLLGKPTAPGGVASD